MNSRNKFIRIGSGTASMIFGTLFVFALLISMNEAGRAPDKETDTRQVGFEAQKRVEPPKKKEVEKKERKEEAPQWKPPAALQGLDSQLAGVDVGLPSLGLNDMVRPSDALLGAGDNIVMTDDTVDVPPRPIKRGAIDYPASAKTRGIEGYVVLNLLITSSGEVAKVSVLESTPAGVFDRIAADSVRQWQFEPAVYKGNPVKVWAKQTIRFDLG